MNKHKCPSCDVPLISVWQKLWLGPLRKVECKNCGAFVSVPMFKSSVVMVVGSVIPWVLGFFFFSLVPKPVDALGFVASFFSGFILGVVLFFWFYNRYVPLVMKSAK